jgi:hypothetical protein
MNKREALKHRIGEWLFSPKWTDTNTEYDEIEALSEFVESETREPYTEQLETLLYDAIVELEYVQSVENCNSGLCATAKGKHIVDLGMATLGVDDLSAETWNEAREKAESA